MAIITTGIFIIYEVTTSIFIIYEVWMDLKDTLGTGHIFRKLHIKGGRTNL